MEPTRISIEEARERFDAEPQLLFLDTRSAEAWEKSDVTIPGAIRMPVDAIEGNLAQIPRDRPIITYCT